MTDKNVTPRDIAREAVERLRRLADPARAEGVQRYFKDTIKSYGIYTDEVRALAAELHQSVRGTWTAAEAIELCDILFAEPELEAKGVGALVLSRFKKDLPRFFFARLKGWLAADRLDNWASVDVLCTDVMAVFLEKYPDCVEKIKTWAGHPNRWVKRASLVSFIKLARKPEFLPVIYDISASLFASGDDLVRKANGWLLREAGKRDPGRLESFLLRHGPAIPRTTLRYAIERFPEAERRRLLQETRAK
jgi:3-methyladenine DNA glycosylase AlkD